MTRPADLIDTVKDVKTTAPKKGTPILLENAGDVHTIPAPEEGKFGLIRAILKWTQPPGVPRASGFIGRMLPKRQPKVDLDIGCLYELSNGTRGCIQGLGNLYGALEKAPFIKLTADDKSGESKGEELVINAHDWSHFKRIIIYAYLYDGVAAWDYVDAQISLRIPQQPIFKITPTSYEYGKGMCAIVELSNKDGDLHIKNLTEYYPGHSEMDYAHGFGLRWVIKDK